MIACCSADDRFLPPVLIFKGINSKPEFPDGLPAGSKVYMNKKSSFINSELFLRWLTEEFIPNKPTGKYFAHTRWTHTTQHRYQYASSC